MAKMILTKNTIAAVRKKLKDTKKPQYWLGELLWDRYYIPLSSSRISKMMTRKEGLTLPQVQQLARWLGAYHWSQIIEE